MAVFPRPVMMMIWSHPAASASSTPYWMIGLSTSGSISLGWALVAGRNRVPRPAAGKTALRTFIFMLEFYLELLILPERQLMSARSALTGVGSGGFRDARGLGAIFSARSCPDR